jgi:ribosome biogenesis GTPase
VDTPGIRQFDLWSVAPGELEACFIEFGPHIQKCRFRDCHHTDEDGCAIVAAVEAGAISERRYRSYVKMLEEMARGPRK